MKKNQIILAKLLTYSGTIPFIASLFLTSYSLHEMHTSVVVITYSAIISSYICGIHWAIYIFFADKCPRHLLISSNTLTLLVWISTLIPYQSLVPLLHAVGFFYLLTIDSLLCDISIIPKWFYILRRNATIIVVTCLIILSKLI